MTIRNDLSVDFTVSPRIITVASPSTELTMQDALDTLRSIEASTSAMDDKPLIDAAGKEGLGGGTSVGLTLTMLNSLIAFEARTVPASSGTATSVGTTLLNDSAATFISDGVLAGSMLINFTDFSLGTVICANSETQLLIQALQGGTNNDWTIGDTYRVYNEIQCNLGGGNMVAVDDVGADIDPVFPTVGTQIVRSSSSSATQSDLAAIQYASFGGGVWVDETSTNAGTIYPNGNEEHPSNNITDAEFIADSKGFRTFFIKTSMTLTGAIDFSDGHKFIGFSPVTVAMVVDPSVNVLNCEFSDMQISGTLDGNSVFRSCIVGTVNYINGFIDHCVLGGVITLAGGATASLHNCWQQLGGTVPTVDMGGAGGQQLSIAGFVGHILISNNSVFGHNYIQCTGEVELDSTITEGHFHIFGDCLVENNAGPNVIVEVHNTAEVVWSDSRALTVDNFIGLK